MASDLTNNPLRMDADDDTIDKVTVQQIIWSNTAADEIADNDDLIIVVNGTTLNFRCDLKTAMAGAVCVSMGPWAKPVYCSDVTITTIDSGELQIWLAPTPPESITL